MATDIEPFGGEGGMVEVDETYIGKKPGAEVKPGGSHKHSVMTLIDRDSGTRAQPRYQRLQGFDDWPNPR